MRRKRYNSDPEKLAIRMAVRSAVGRVALRLLSEKGLTQIELSGVSDLCRTTIRNIITAGEVKGASSPGLDTISDILSGLQVTPAEFWYRVAQDLAEDLPADKRGMKAEAFEVRVGELLLKGKVIHLPGERNDQYSVR